MRQDDLWAILAWLLAGFALIFCHLFGLILADVTRHVVPPMRINGLLVFLATAVLFERSPSQDAKKWRATLFVLSA